MSKDLHNHNLYANHIKYDPTCERLRNEFREEIWGFVTKEAEDAVNAAEDSARRAKESETITSNKAAEVAYNLEQTIQYTQQAKNFSDNTDKNAAEVGDNLDQIKRLHKEVEDNTTNTIQNTNTAINKAAEAGKYADAAKVYADSALESYNKTVGCLKPRGDKTFAQLQALGSDGKFESYMYTITDKFTTDSTFAEGAGVKCYPGTNVYWNNGKWHILSGGGSASVILDSANDSEITIAKSKTKPATASEIAIWNGNELMSMDVKSLFLMMYPVGSIYINTSGVNPSTFMGGTWVVWGSGRVPVGVNTSDGNFNTVEKTGGSATHAHTSAAHTHTIAHTHTGPSHTHTGPSHVHNMEHTHTGPSHTHTGPSHTHSVSGLAHIDIRQGTESGKVATWINIDRTGGVSPWPSREYKFTLNTVGMCEEVGSHDRSNTGISGTAAASGTGATGWAGDGTTSGSSSTNTGWAGTGATGVAGTGNTSGASVANTGSTTPGNTGSSSNLPPYITCYMWKRTA